MFANRKFLAAAGERVGGRGESHGAGQSARGGAIHVEERADCRWGIRRCIVFHPPPRGCATPAPIWAAHTAGTRRTRRWDRCGLGSLRGSQPDGRGEHRAGPADPDRVYWPAAPTPTQAPPMAPSCVRRTAAGRSSAPMCPSSSAAMKMAAATANVCRWTPTTATCSTWARQAGLWKSTDGAVTWRPCGVFPEVTEAPPAAAAGEGAGRAWSGIVVTLFDRAAAPRQG